MRILTVRQPYAWAIIHGDKDVENRSRNIAGSYCGPVAIHAGLRHDFNADTYTILHLARRFPDRFGQYRRSHWTYGAIIGVADLVDAHGEYDCPGLSCSPWAEEGSVHLVLTNPRPLPEPIPYRGALGLRELPPEVEAQIWEALR